MNIYQGSCATVRRSPSGEAMGPDRFLDVRFLTVLPADRPISPASISEIRGFLAGRGPAQTGTLQVFLHLKPAGK